MSYAYEIAEMGGEKEMAQGALLMAAVVPAINMYNAEAASDINDNMKFGETPHCEIIGDFVYYLVPHGISIQVSSYRTFVLTYILAIGFKTPTRGFSRFSRNLN